VPLVATPRSERVGPSLTHAPGSRQSGAPPGTPNEPGPHPPVPERGGFYLARYPSTIPLSIKDPETDRLARELASATGESLTTAVAVALRERLERVRGRALGQGLVDELDAIAVRCARLPVLDDRPEDEVLGYDEHGLPA
jgi:antitoxin VapB